MIIGFVEHDRGNWNKSTFEMLTFARALASDLGMPLEAVLIGADVYDSAEDLEAYGVSRVHLFEDDELEEYAPAAIAQCIVNLIGDEQPEAVLASGTERGNEVMAYVGARLDLSVAANTLTITTTGDTYELTRVRWGGSLLEDATLSGETKLLTIAEHSLEATTAPLDDDIEIEEHDVEIDEKDLRVRITRRVTPEKQGVSLTDARIVISGGRGVGSAEGFSKLEDLAGLVEGAVGCSRAVTNNGWRPHADQVGQTGARVAPDLYIACGISGASQHMAGCSGAKKLLVINTDKEAPILQRADYAVIGDLHEVLPAICEAVKKLR